MSDAALITLAILFGLFLGMFCAGVIYCFLRYYLGVADWYEAPIHYPEV